MRQRFIRLLPVALMIGMALPALGQDRYSAQVAASVVNGRGILAGDPGKERTIFDDFDFLTTTHWDTTSVTGGIVTLGDSSSATSAFYAGRVAELRTLNAAQRRTRLYWKGQGIQLFANKRTEFEIRIAAEDTANASWVAGLVKTGVDSLAGVGNTVADGVYFLKKTGSAVLWSVKAYTGAPADSTALGYYGRVPRMTWKTLKIVWTGTRLQYYVDGRLCKGYTASTKPLVSLFPFVEIRTNTAAVRKVYVDYILVRQQR